MTYLSLVRSCYHLFLCSPRQKKKFQIAQFLIKSPLLIECDIWEYQKLTRKTEAGNFKIFWEASAFKKTVKGGGVSKAPGTQKHVFYGFISSGTGLSCWPYPASDHDEQ